MSAAALPVDESRRLAALASYEILDTPSEPSFDELVRLAADVCGAPVALISLVDASRQWFKARVGFDRRETPRAHSFCAHALGASDLLVVEDALRDPRFASNPLVVRSPFIRFYAGAQLVTPEGHHLGTLCVIDVQPRTVTSEQRTALRVLARQVMLQLESRRDAARLERAQDALRRTEQRVSVERREVERLKSDFIAAVSHELRTPLTSIRGSLGLLASGVVGSLSDEARQVVRVAERNSVRLISLINDILDFEKLESGVEKLDLAPTALRRVIEAGAARSGTPAERERIVIDTAAVDTLVYAHAARLTQVVENLLSNALKYSRAGEPVRVSAVVREGVVEVTVEDRGIGIDDGAQSKLFERFRQIDSGDCRARPGTGLGLALCKAIVDLHGGTIGVRSRPGEGSTFWFTLAHAGANGS